MTLQGYGPKPTGGLKGHDAQASTTMKNNFWQLWPQRGQLTEAGNMF